MTATLPSPPLILAAHYNFLFEKNVRSGDLTDTKQQNSGREKPREREKKKKEKLKTISRRLYISIDVYAHGF